MTKNYNSSKSNTWDPSKKKESSVEPSGGDGGGGPDDLAEGPTKCPKCGWNTCRCGRAHACSNTSGICPTCGKNRGDASPGEGGGPDDIDIEDPIKSYNTSKSNTSSRTDVDGGGNGGNGVEKGFKGGATAADATVCEGIDTGGGNGGKAALNQVSSGGGDSSTKSLDNMLNYDTFQRSGGSLTKNTGKKGPGIVRKGVGKTLGLAKTVIMTAVLISVAGAGVDVYQTYNDAIAIDLEEHITDADFELSDDKSEISGTVGFDIPEMGMFEKSIIASVHVTVLESNPTTEGDYKFEYTLGSGEQFYDFTLGNLDPVTVEKIEAGEPLDLEYSGTISVTYFGVEIPSVTMDIPLPTTTVETA